MNKEAIARFQQAQLDSTQGRTCRAFYVSLLCHHYFTNTTNNNGTAITTRTNINNKTKQNAPGVHMIHLSTASIGYDTYVAWLHRDHTCPCSWR